MRALAVAAIVGAGCRPKVPAAPRPLALVEEHCWWAAFRTTLPADTVAARFAGAFTRVGLTGATWVGGPDTAWAYAGPSTLGPAPGAAVGAAGDTSGAASDRAFGGRLARELGGAPYAARVVAVRRGDSTLFRHYVAAGPLARDSAGGPGEGGRRIALCGALGAAAQARGTAPREPSGEEGWPVWERGRRP